jgi:hypothetical protein
MVSHGYDQMSFLFECHAHTNLCNFNCWNSFKVTQNVFEKHSSEWITYGVNKLVYEVMWNRKFLDH